MYIYSRLINYLEALIENDNYTTGHKLPSIQSLAVQHNCSKSTVIRALYELEKRHLIYSVPKSGYYVVKESIVKMESKLSVLDFATTSPDPSLFPYFDFQHCLNKAIDQYQRNLFSYGSGRGLESLLQTLRDHLSNYQIFATERQIFVVSGVQQALSLLSLMPFPNGKSKVLVEQPSYHLFLEFLQTYHIPVVYIRRTASGIDFNQLESLFKHEDIKFFFTMPRFHNPLGTSYTRNEKRQILELANKYDVYIVEDDYLADYEQNPKEDPLFAYDNSAHTIYLKSFSKIIFPGLRLGVTVVPPQLIEIFNTFKRQNDIDSSMLSQSALEIYIKSGMFDRHREKIRNRYTTRSQLLDKALQKEYAASGGAFSYSPSNQSSMHTHITLNSEQSILHLIDELRKKSIVIDSIARDYLSFVDRDPLIKLNVTNVRDEDIANGIHLITESIRRKIR